MSLDNSWKMFWLLSIRIQSHYYVVLLFARIYVADVFWGLSSQANCTSYAGIGSHSWASEAFPNKKVSDEGGTYCSRAKYFFFNGETRCMEC